MTPLFVYVTTGSPAEAETIATAAIDARLAACANILPGMTSLYRWQGAVQKTAETVLILKTLDTHFTALEKLVRDKHSYDTPCIMALPVTKGNEDFLNWIAGEVTA